MEDLILKKPGGSPAIQVRAYSPTAPDVLFTRPDPIVIDGREMKELRHKSPFIVPDIIWVPPTTSSPDLNMFYQFLNAVSLLKLPHRGITNHLSEKLHYFVRFRLYNGSPLELNELELKEAAYTLNYAAFEAQFFDGIANKTFPEMRNQVNGIVVQREGDDDRKVTIPGMMSYSYGLNSFDRTNLSFKAIPITEGGLTIQLGPEHMLLLNKLDSHNFDSAFPGDLFADSTVVNIAELVDMLAQYNAFNLHPETREKLRIEYLEYVWYKIQQLQNLNVPEMLIVPTQLYGKNSNTDFD